MADRRQILKWLARITHFLGDNSRQLVLSVLMVLLVFGALIVWLVLQMRRDISYEKSPVYWIFLAVAIAFALASVIIITRLYTQWSRQRRRELRFEQGRCPNCGYDLRGLRQRCPECGNLIRRNQPPISTNSHR